MGIRLSDTTRLLEFLSQEKVATLAVPVDEAGTLHIATMNYVHLLNPLRFYFMTSDQSEKCRLMNVRPEIVAACSVGTYSGTPFTLQMRGQARILDTAGQAQLLDTYYAKRGDTNRNVEGPHSVLVEFKPNWARFTDYSKGWDTTMLDLT